MIRAKSWVLPGLSALRRPSQGTAETNKNSERVMQVTAKTFPKWANGLSQKITDNERFKDQHRFVPCITADMLITYLKTLLCELKR